MNFKTVTYENNYVIGQTITMQGAAPTKVTMPASIEGILRAIRITPYPSNRQFTADNALAIIGSLLIEYCNVASKVVLQNVSAVPYCTYSVTRDGHVEDSLGILVSANQAVELQLRDISAPVQSYPVQVDFVFSKISMVSKV